MKFYVAALHVNGSRERGGIGGCEQSPGEG
jgi:hypothetical protein